MPQPVVAAREWPDSECALCPRLAKFRADNRVKFPAFHNAPVTSFGDPDGRLLIVGLAPGLKGANQTGRPFTGDYAGDLLYATLEKFDLSTGNYGGHAGDGLDLVDCRITNAVRCVPPENKPTGPEGRACAPFLAREIADMRALRVILALGGLAHGAVLSVRGERKANFKFGHGAMHTLDDGLILANSYHCSRYNTNTGRLTTEMFEDVFRAIRNRLARP